MVILVPLGKSPILPQIKKRASPSTRFILRCLLKNLPVDVTSSDLLKLSVKKRPEAASLVWVDGGFKKCQSVKCGILIHYQVSVLIFVSVFLWEYRQLQ